VEIEFDPDKDRLNREKHGVSLADATRLDIATAFVVADQRFNYGEARLQAFGLIDNQHPGVHHAWYSLEGDILAQGQS
jgi:uncharacterized DUF497 family protein